MSIAPSSRVRRHVLCLWPAAIAGRLLDYANRLRASAMHADPGITDRASSGTAAASTLTYCQAVLWIDQLLTAIEQANNQLDSIRAIESEINNNLEWYF